MKQSHKFLTYRRKYGKYNMVMTQHIFCSVGIKRYADVNWVVLLNNNHIVLNTYIKDVKIKIDEDFMDSHWNKFVMDYGENLDIWTMAEDKDIVEFNEYSKKLLNRQLTLDDVDEAMAKASEESNNRKHTIRMVKKINKRLLEIYEEIEKMV